MKGFNFDKKLSRMSKKLMKKSWRELKKSVKGMEKIPYNMKGYERELIKGRLNNYKKKVDLNEKDKKANLKNTIMICLIITLVIYDVTYIGSCLGDPFTEGHWTMSGISIFLFLCSPIIIIILFFSVISISSSNAIKREQMERQRRLDAFKTLAQLQQLSGAEFEEWVEHLFKKMGFITSRTQISADKGIDIYLEKSGRKAIVQCKRHIGSVGSSTVRDFYGALVDSLADEGYIVTTGTFTLPSRNWTQGKPINLIDGAELINIIQSLELEKEKNDISKLESDIKEFRDTCLIMVKSMDSEEVLHHEYEEKFKKIHDIQYKINNFEDKINNLKAGEQKRLGNLSKKILDILPELQGLAKRIKASNYEKSNIISKLQENVNKISHPSIKLHYQEIVDNRKEFNNFCVERLILFEKNIKNLYLYYNNYFLFSQGKLTIEEVSIRNEKIEEEGKGIKNRIDEIFNNAIVIDKKFAEISSKEDNLYK